jgi:plasmid stabilization system protein ParE
MVREIRWTIEAVETYDSIVEYLTHAWTEKEVSNFIIETERVIGYITHNPKMFRRYSKLNIREAVIMRYNLMVYKVYPTHIDILTFWSTRKDPRKRKLY